MKKTESPRKKIKICLNKKNNKCILGNNNTNIIKRKNNNLHFPSEMKKYQKKIMDTDNHIFKTQDIPANGVVITKYNNNKGAGKMHMERDKLRAKLIELQEHAMKKDNQKIHGYQSIKIEIIY